MASEPTLGQIASGEFIRVGGGALREQMVRLFVALKVPEEHAAIASDILVASDLRGVDTHGVVTGLRYLEQIEAGLIDPTVTPRLVRETAGSASWARKWRCVWRSRRPARPASATSVWLMGGTSGWSGTTR